MSETATLFLHIDLKFGIQSLMDSAYVMNNRDQNNRGEVNFNLSHKKPAITLVYGCFRIYSDVELVGRGHSH